jgi:hypothetical protein
MSPPELAVASRAARRRLLLRIGLVLTAVVVVIGSVVLVHCQRFKRSAEAQHGLALDYHGTYVTEQGRIIVGFVSASMPGFTGLLYGAAWPDGEPYHGIGEGESLLWLLDTEASAADP